MAYVIIQLNIINILKFHCLLKNDHFSFKGVFGFINKMRIQVVMEYTHDETSPFNWEELDFKCIPGSLDRRPCFLSPYHSRLDWETWIRVTASFEHVVDRYSYSTLT